ncbi:MAG: PAS domain S-box protein [Candidatus Odinarchaeota archaeon]
MRVLHVDDDVEFLKCNKKNLIKLSNKKIEIDTLSNPELVIQELQKKTYDVIVSDYQIPEMDGLALLEQIRKENIQIPYIIFTGHSREEIAIKALNLGADKYVIKNMDQNSQTKELLQAIETTVKKYRDHLALIKSEELYNFIFNEAPVSIGIHSDEKIRILNKEGRKTLGGKSEEGLIGKPIWNFVSPDAIKPIKDRVDKVYQKEIQKERAEIKYYRLDGSTIDVGLRSTTCEFQGKPGSLVAFMDITEQKKAERALRVSEDRFRKIFEKANIGMVITDLKLTIIAANKAYCDIVGIPESEIVGIKTEIITPPEDFFAKQKNIKKRIYHQFYYATKYKKENLPYLQYEKRYVRPDGEIVWVYLTGFKIFSENTEKENYIAMVEDITEKKKALQQLKEERDRAQKYLDIVEIMMVALDLEGNITVPVLFDKLGQLLTV